MLLICCYNLNMKILIVGGGVGGPALARFMKDHAEITLVDKAPAWGNIGYAITLWGNGQKILRDLGVDNKVLKDGYEIPWNTMEDRKGRILRVAFFDIYRRYGPTMVVTRSALQQALVKDLENSVKIKLGMTVASIVQDEKSATVIFSDGSTENFDLVVGADGIHSVVRELVFGKNFLKYYGWKVYAFWTPKNIAPPKGAIEFSDNGKICFIYPMEDRAVVVLMLASKNENEVFDKSIDSQKLLHNIFSDFKDSVDHLIDGIEDPAHIFRDNLAYI